MTKYVKYIIPPVLLLPLVASAELSNTTYLIASVGNLVEDLIRIVVAIALLVFLWGLAKFIFKIGGDEAEIEKGKALMKWGLIALFVMLSVWGIIKFFQEELGLQDTSAIDIGNVIPDAD